MPLPEARAALRPERLVRKAGLSLETASALSAAWLAVAEALATPAQARLPGADEALARSEALKSLEPVWAQMASAAHAQDYKGQPMNTDSFGPQIRAAERAARGLGLGAEQVDELWELAFNRLLMTYSTHPEHMWTLNKAAREVCDRHALSERLAWTLAEEMAGEALAGLREGVGKEGVLAVCGMICVEALERFERVALSRAEPGRARGWLFERECRLCEGMLEVCEATASAPIAQSESDRSRSAQMAARGDALRLMVQASRSARPGPNVKQRKILEAGAEPAGPRGASMG